MAAHILTVIDSDILTDRLNCEYLYFGLAHARFGDQIPYEAWVRMRSAAETGDAKKVRQIATEIRPELEKEWRELGKPSCYEEWMKAKYYPEESAL